MNELCWGCHRICKLISVIGLTLLLLLLLELLEAFIVLTRNSTMSRYRVRMSLLPLRRQFYTTANAPSRAFCSLLGTRAAFARSTQSGSLSTRLPHPARTRVLARWNSSSAEAPKQEPDDKLADAQQEQDQDIDPMKKDLDAKEKEIIDLKVRWRWLHVASHSSSLTRKQNPIMSAKC